MLETFGAYVRNIPQPRVKVLLTGINILFERAFFNMCNRVNCIVGIY